MPCLITWNIIVADIEDRLIALNNRNTRAVLSFQSESRF
jgi:hypothetical protein